MEPLYPLLFSPRSDVLLGGRFNINDIVGIRADPDGDGTWVDFQWLLHPQDEPENKRPAIFHQHTHTAFLDVVTWVSEAQKRPVLHWDKKPE